MPTGRWIDALPASWGPYLELSRLHSPVGFLIIFFPHCFGVLHAARGHALADDRKIGVHSTAILFGRHTRTILWALLLGMSGALAVSGYITGAGLPYFILTVGGCVASVGCMIANVDLSNPSSCWAWLSTECWTTGGAISTSLLVEYLLSAQ